jgi:DNA-binding response OmpR family regulator
VKVDGVSEQSGRILVVDDDETVRDVVRRYLELAGFTVDLAGDGAEGLRVFAERPPDLVVLDVMMPGINGLEVCKRLRQVSQVPIVMLTALGEEENRIAGLQLGADDYVTKPFSPKELALRVTSVLRRSRMPHQAPASADPQRHGTSFDHKGVRPAGVLPQPSGQGVLPGRSAGEGVGLGLR